MGDGSPSPSAVFVSSGLAYVAGGDSGLSIVDISDPTAPVEVGHLGPPDVADDVFVSNGTALVVDWDEGLRIVDVSDPSAPVRVSALALNTRDYLLTAWNAVLSDDVAYVAASGIGTPILIVVDVADPTAPSELGSLSSPGFFASDVFFSDDLVFMAGAVLADGGPIGRLLIADVSVPSDPVEVGFVDLPISLATDVFVSGDLAFVAAWDEGVRIVDVSNPAEPVEVGAIEVQDLSVFDVFVSDGLIFMAGSLSQANDAFANELLMGEKGGLLIVDVSDPAAPVEVGSIDGVSLATFPPRVFVSNGLVFFAAGKSGLLIIRPESVSH